MDGRKLGRPQRGLERPAEHPAAYQYALELSRAHLPRRTDGPEVKFYFPDSQDLVSPTYEFQPDEYVAHLVRQRDDRYAHEVLARAPYHGVLVSKSIVDGSIRGAGKYS